MKWMYLLLVTWIGFGSGSCNHKGSGSGASDSTLNNQIVPPAPDNSQATNPSLADTAYSKKDSVTKSSDSVPGK